MANENETVERVCDILLDERRLALRDRILAAHKREIAAKDAEIAAYHGERKGILKANESFATENDRLRGEVESLKWKVENYAQVVAAKDNEITSLRELVNELADVADEYFDDDRIRALVAKAREVCK